MNVVRRCTVLDPAAVLAGLLQFHALHATTQPGLIQPVHKTSEEKRVAAKARCRLRELEKRRTLGLNS